MTTHRHQGWPFGSPFTRVVAAMAFVLCALPAPAQDAASHIRQAGAEFGSIERVEVDKLSAALDEILADKALMKTFRERDRAKLLSEARPLFKRLKTQKAITHFYFLEPEPGRTCFLRVHAPEQFGDVVQRATFTKAIQSGKVGAGMELGKTAFALRVVKPVREAGKVVGYVELGEEIDQFLTRMKKQTGDDYTIFADKARISRKDWERVRPESKWDELPSLVLVESTIWNSKLVDIGRPIAQLPPQGLMLPPWTDLGKRYVGAVFPIPDATGNASGALFVRQLVTER
jgi:hypothetical protein